MCSVPIETQALLKRQPKHAALPGDASSAIETMGAAKFTRNLRQLFHSDFDLSDALARIAVGPGSNRGAIAALANLTPKPIAST
jgi:hypothetical protein